MKTKILSILALAALPFAGALAQSNMEVYGDEDVMLKTFALDDIQSVKFVDQTMAVNLRSDAQSPFTIATEKVSRLKFKMAKASTPVIEIVEADAPATYYTLQGMIVANPAKGNLYIRVQGNKATKVIF